jgi:hypothetical protein
MCNGPRYSLGYCQIVFPPDIGFGGPDPGRAGGPPRWGRAGVVFWFGTFAWGGCRVGFMRTQSDKIGGENRGSLRPTRNPLRPGGGLSTARRKFRRESRSPSQAWRRPAYPGWRRCKYLVNSQERASPESPRSLPKRCLAEILYRRRCTGIFEVNTPVMPATGPRGHCPADKTAE